MSANGTKTSKKDIEAKLDEIRASVPSAENWTILTSVGEGYTLFEKGNGGNLRHLLDLGDSAPEAISVLNGVMFAIVNNLT